MRRAPGSRTDRALALCAASTLCAALALAACASTGERLPTLRYVGSSTVANFLRDAEPVYGQAQFLLDTLPESAGGELAILEGRADIAGVAGAPRDETLAQGVVATLLGRDAIAVVVHDTNPVRSVSLEQLRGIFTGEIASWSEVGGPDVPIRPLIVGPGSATRKVFRSIVLREDDYGGCEVVSPDGAILDRVRGDPGAIGQLSLSFRGAGVRRLAVDGEEPSLGNPNYPITRPLYLLTWPGRERVADFALWAQSAAGRDVLQRRSVALEPGGER